MITVYLLLAVLSIVSPEDGAMVPTLTDLQKSYFKRDSTQRFALMENAAERKKFCAEGAVQKPLRLSWTGDTNAVYLLSVDGGEAFTISNRTHAYITNLEIGKRFKWSVRLAGSSQTASAEFVTEDIPPRFIKVDGIVNCRDLGGWRTVDGRRVRENMILRSGRLINNSKAKGGPLGGKVVGGSRCITDAGIATLCGDFKIRTEIEMRSVRETMGMDQHVLGENVKWAPVPFDAYNFIENPVKGKEPFAKMFRLLANKDSYPILMHCSGGRDRTGTMAFLLLGILGVSEDDLCREWESSIFETDSPNFRTDSIMGLLNYLHSLAGKTMQENIEAYAMGCGITGEEIAAFRSIMLE